MHKFLKRAVTMGMVFTITSYLYFPIYERAIADGENNSLVFLMLLLLEAATSVFCSYFTIWVFRGTDRSLNENRTRRD